MIARLMSPVAAAVMAATGTALIALARHLYHALKEQQ